MRTLNGKPPLTTLQRTLMGTSKAAAAGVFVLFWALFACNFVSSVTKTTAHNMDTSAVGMTLQPEDAYGAAAAAAAASSRNISSTTNASDNRTETSTSSAPASVGVKSSTGELPFSESDTNYSSVGLTRGASFGLKSSGALLRAFYVTMGVTLIVVVYFAVKAVRLRRRRNKLHKYGIVSTNGGDLELTPFDMQDDDDETTVFEVSTNHA